jgi:hypothetical protein
VPTDIGLSVGLVVAMMDGLATGLGVWADISTLAGTRMGFSTDLVSAAFTATTGVGLAAGFAVSDTPFDTFALSGLPATSGFVSAARPFEFSTATTSPSGVSSIR